MIAELYGVEKMARQLGMRVDIIAREYTTRGLALAIAEALP